MNLFATRNLTLVLMLAAFPLISIGMTGDRPALWWAGLVSFGIGSLIPPVMRFLPRADEAAPAEAAHKEPTDLGDSCRVC